MMKVTQVNLDGRGGEECAAEAFREDVDVAAAVELLPASGTARRYQVEVCWLLSFIIHYFNNIDTSNDRY